jgi:hypothetical protein
VSGGTRDRRKGPAIARQVFNLSGETMATHPSHVGDDGDPQLVALVKSDVTKTANGARRHLDCLLGITVPSLAADSGADGNYAGGTVVAWLLR